MSIWEHVANTTQRLEVPGGWIYRTTQYTGTGVSESSVFVPKPVVWTHATATIGSVDDGRRGTCGCDNYMRCADPECAPLGGW